MENMTRADLLNYAIDYTERKEKSLSLDSNDIGMEMMMEGFFSDMKTFLDLRRKELGLSAEYHDSDMANDYFDKKMSPSLRRIESGEGMTWNDLFDEQYARRKNAKDESRK